MQKVRFLQDFYTFNKDTYRVVMAEDNEYYYIQRDLQIDKELFRLTKRENGVIYQVVERS